MSGKSESSMNGSETPFWLYSFGAADIGYSSNKKGKVSYFVDEDDVSTITAFTDRPKRVAGTTNIKKFARNFKRMFGDGKPNASLTHWTDGKFYNGVFEIKSIKKKNGKYHIKTDSLLKDHLTGAMAHEPLLGKMSALMDQSAATKVIAQASFFIDSSSEGSEANCTQTQLFELQNSASGSGCGLGEYFDTATCSCEATFIDLNLSQ